MSALPFADLTSLGGGVWVGDVVQHPVAGTRLRVTLATPTERTTELLDGPICVGRGVLRLRDGAWTGEVSEYAATWKLHAKIGEGRVSFAE